jgi:hypothetical protein
VKRKEKILSLVSAILAVLFLIGSTGAVIVKHTCMSSGRSDYQTELFSSSGAETCCTSMPVHNSNEESIGPVCCTYNSDKLSLTDYTKVQNTVSSFIALPAVLSETVVTSDPEVKHEPVIIFHNKHGGRDVIKHTCQLLI